MRSQEIRDRSDQELERLAVQLREDLFRLRVRKATNQLENTDTIRLARRDLARALTIQRARVLGREASKQGS